MNCIDPLTSIISILQSNRVVTAEDISKYFEICVRNINLIHARKTYFRIVKI